MRRVEPGAARGRSPWQATSDSEKRVLPFPQQGNPAATERATSLVPVFDDQADDESEKLTDDARQKELFAWGDSVLEDIGLTKAVAAAKSLFVLLNITLDLKDPGVSTKVDQAIQKVLHPGTGKRRRAHFVGLRAAQLERLLLHRLNNLKKDRKHKLLRPKERDWTEDLVKDKDGKPVNVLANFITYLRHVEAWDGIFAWDMCALRPVVRKTPPWETAKKDKTAEDKKADRCLIDTDETWTRVWFQQRGMKPAVGDIKQAIPAVAMDHSFHPVKERLEKLPLWDNEVRSETFLIKYFHVEDTPYVRAISRRWLISLVARAFRPGCQLDSAVVIEGAQGIGKQQALRLLAIQDMWYSNQIKNITEKNIAYLLRGKWIVELSEMLALLHASDAARKAFLEQREDEFRRPQQRHTIYVPRSSIYVITTNWSPGDAGYLSDVTGGRRYWPFFCRSKIDLDGLALVCDQLLAESVHLFKAGHPWHLETDELEALAAIEQDLRFQVNPLEAPIRVYLQGKAEASVTNIMVHLFGAETLEDKDLKRMQERMNRVQAAVTRIGYTDHVRSRMPAGKRPWVYRKPIVIPEE